MLIFFLFLLLYQPPHHTFFHKAVFFLFFCSQQSFLDTRSNSQKLLWNSNDDPQKTGCAICLCPSPHHHHHTVGLVCEHSLCVCVCLCLRVATSTMNVKVGVPQFDFDLCRLCRTQHFINVEEAALCYFLYMECMGNLRNPQSHTSIITQTHWHLHTNLSCLKSSFDNYTFAGFSLSDAFIHFCHLFLCFEGQLAFLSNFIKHRKYLFRKSVKTRSNTSFRRELIF